MCSWGSAWPWGRWAGSPLTSAVLMAASVYSEGAAHPTLRSTPQRPSLGQTLAPDPEPRSRPRPSPRPRRPACPAPVPACPAPSPQVPPPGSVSPAHRPGPAHRRLPRRGASAQAHCSPESSAPSRSFPALHKDGGRGPALGAAERAEAAGGRWRQQQRWRPRETVTGVGRGGRSGGAVAAEAEAQVPRWAGKGVGEAAGAAPPLPELRHRELPSAPARVPLPAGGGDRTVSRENRRGHGGE